MKIILTTNIKKLGKIGELVNVKDGFAKNYLLPQKKAMRANSENKKRFEESKAQLEANNLKLRKEAEEVSKSFENLSTIIIRQAGESGQLYGSVTSRDITKSLINDGISISKKQIKLQKTIKQLGIFKTEVILHPEVSAMINVNVARSNEEAGIQAEGNNSKSNNNNSDNSEVEVPSDFFETEEAALKAKQELQNDNEEISTINEETTPGENLP